MKEYRIETIQDIINATNSDSLDSFLIDLKGVVASSHLIQAMGGRGDIKGGFTWIDDGKNDVTITLKPILTKKQNKRSN